MSRPITNKLRAAYRSMTVWALGLGLAASEALPYIVEALPMAQQAFDDDTYRLIVRATFVLGIVLRVRRTGATPTTTEGK